MRAQRIFPALAIIVALSACAHRPTVTATPPQQQQQLIESRGVVMSLAQAMQKVTFRPYLPPGRILTFAVIPPLGGADTPAHRGIAIEYTAQRNHLLLSQWPRQSFKLAIGTTEITHHPCAIVHYSVTKVMWATHSNLVMTLQPDGRVRPAIIDAQARRLLALGACGIRASPVPLAR